MGTGGSVGRRGRALRGVLLSAVVAVLLAEAGAVLVALTDSPRSVPDWFGNGTAAVGGLAALPPPRDYTFWMIGDTNGSGTYEGFMDQLARARPTCAVLLGDVVGNGTEGDHTFFRAELREMAIPCPVLCVPGNHDIDAQTFPLSRFRDSYGPVPTAVPVGPDLFLLLPLFADNLDGGRQAEEAARFLDETLAGRRDSYRYVFLFCHSPVGIFPGWERPDWPAYVHLAELMGRYRLTACFAGHLHLHQETEASGTRYFISGGGGSRLLRGVAGSGQFFHSLVVKVTADDWVCSVLPLQERTDVEDKMEWWVLARFWPYVRREPGSIVAIAGNVLIVGMLVVAFRRARGGPLEVDRSLESGRSQEAGGG